MGTRARLVGAEVVAAKVMADEETDAQIRVREVVAELAQRCMLGPDVTLGGVGPREAGRVRRRVEPDAVTLGAGGNVVAQDVVGMAEPEG